jgi:integrase
LVEDLGPERVADLSPQRLARWARTRHEQGAGGYTVNMELSQLGTAIRHTGAYLQVPLPDVVGVARPLLHYGQLITGGGRRTRRPTEDELQRLLAWLDAHRGCEVGDAVRMAAITGLRRGELVRIVWADVDELRRAVLVRQRKHPRRIEARDEWVPLLGDSWAIVKRQPRVDARIFPVSAEKLTDSVTAGTKALGIPDLRLHDMRREATSALRKRGFDADARKAVTGHRSDAVHERYVAVSLESLHEQYAAKPAKRSRRR